MNVSYVCILISIHYPRVGTLRAVSAILGVIVYYDYIRREANALLVSTGRAILRSLRL